MTGVRSRAGTARGTRSGPARRPRPRPRHRPCRRGHRPVWPPAHHRGPYPSRGAHSSGPRNPTSSQATVRPIPARPKHRPLTNGGGHQTSAAPAARDPSTRTRPGTFPRCSEVEAPLPREACVPSSRNALERGFGVPLVSREPSSRFVDSAGPLTRTFTVNFSGGSRRSQPTMAHQPGCGLLLTSAAAGLGSVRLASGSPSATLATHRQGTLCLVLRGASCQGCRRALVSQSRRAA